MPVRKEAPTATPRQSVWKPITENDFRRNLIALSRVSKGVPCDPRFELSSQISIRNHWSSNQNRILSFETEQRLADDFAFIAAAKEGAEGVTAVCIEEQKPIGLTVRVAANDGVKNEVRAGLRSICSYLTACAKDNAKVDDCIAKASASIVELNQKRIIARIRFCLGQPPSFHHTATVPMVASGFKSALARMRALASRPAATYLVNRLSKLEQEFEAILDSTGPIELCELQKIVKLSFMITTCNGQTTFRMTLVNAGLNYLDWFHNKYIMQVDKLGAYHRIPETLVREAHRRNSRALFSNIALEYVNPYMSKVSSISLNGGNISCHVHAEVQLVIHYIMSSATPCLPRIVGASKAACYLCHLFVIKHAQFVVSAVHGRLYDQWTIPDLEDYSSDHFALLRTIISQMNREFLQLISKTSKWRPYPLTSRHNLQNLPKYSSRSSIFSMRNDTSVRQMQTVHDQSPNRSGISTPKPLTEGNEGIIPAQNETILENIVLLPQSDLEATWHLNVNSQKFGASLSQDQSSGQRALNVTINHADHLSENHLFPIRITPEKPFLSCTPGLEIFVEIEEPSSGSVKLRSHGSGESIPEGNYIDFRNFRMREEVCFQRREEENALTLCFLRDSDDIHSMTLQWL